MEWQPIDSAPKDGTRVLGYCEANGIRYIAVIWYRGEKFKDSLYQWRIAHDDASVGGFGEGLPNGGATHWQPLPPPPATPKKEEA